MSENKSSASSSKDELEQLSAIEESMASFGIGDLDSEHGVILKDWSAQDFANIYVRLRPHLISHAQRFLREETQAEEVVQDAFLYLMTALPELDSELGVLRFLKWKTKMLCLDIIRSSHAGLNNNLVPLLEDVPDEAQPHDSLERADDAAIIRLALAKLNPRHREALISTMYEEKSQEAVAKQMGVGENAFRQLLFRARASFRQSLTQTTREQGIQVSELFAKQASSTRRTPARYLGAAGVFLIAGWLSSEVLSGPVSDNQAFTISASQSGLTPRDVGNDFGGLKTGAPMTTFISNAAPDDWSFAAADRLPTSLVNQLAVANESNSIIVQASDEQSPELEQLRRDDVFEEFAREASGWASQFLSDLTRPGGANVTSAGHNRVILQVGKSSSLSIAFGRDGQDFTLGSAILSGTGDNKGLVAIPTGAFVESTDSELAETNAISLVLTGFAVGSLDKGTSSPVLENSHFSEIGIRVDLLISSIDWSVQFAEASFIPRA